MTPAGGTPTMFDVSADDLIFPLDGLPQAPVASVDALLQWPVQLPSEINLSNSGRQVLAIVQRTVASQGPYIAEQLETLATHLATQLPSVRFALRTASPKRPNGAVEDPSWALRSLRHSVLVATTGDGEELLIEPSFRGHFALPNPSPSYAAGLASVPELLVLPSQAMPRLVHQLAARLAAETRAQGRSLAPWRTASALLTKWLPANYIDTPIPAPSKFAITVAPVHVSSPSANPDVPAAPSSDSSGSSTPTSVSFSPDSVLPSHPASIPLHQAAILSKLGRTPSAPVLNRDNAPAVVVVGFAVQDQAEAAVSKPANMPTAPSPTSVAAAPIFAATVGTAVSKATGASRNKLQALYSMWMPKVHTVKPAGPFVDWSKVVAEPR